MAGGAGAGRERTVKPGWVGGARGVASIAGTELVGPGKKRHVISHGTVALAAAARVGEEGHRLRPARRNLHRLGAARQEKAKSEARSDSPRFVRHGS
jgi:hypothetical protein